MKKISSLVTVSALALLLVACGKETAPPPAAEQQPTPTAPTEAAEPAAEPEAAAETPAESTADSNVPVEAISETDDEPVVETAANVRPALKLGGAANKNPTSPKFKEGTHYVKLVPAQPTSVGPDKVEVVEVFWYGCGHCYALDPALESWRVKNKPAYVEFVRVPAMWNDTLRMHARVFYTAELLGKLDEVHTPVFREIHTKGNGLNTVASVTAFFREHGVGTDEFQKAFSSFAVESKLQRADFLNRRYRIDSVPTIIVNGKYKTDVGMAGGEPQLFQLIGELAAFEHGG
jgi:thiol:disulfide interchange protein DsbA